MDDPLTTAILKLLEELPIVAIVLIMFRWQTAEHSKSISFYRDEQTKQIAWIRDTLSRILERFKMPNSE